jgi:hypothetical protein
MNQSLSAKGFLDAFKKAFPNRSVVASNKTEAYNAISERTNFSPERIRTLIEGPLRKDFILENLCCPEDPSNPVFVEIVYPNAKTLKSKKRKTPTKSNIQNSNNKTETQLENPLKSFSFLEIIDGACCNNIPIKQPIASLKEGVRIVLCICPIHRKAWREGTG